MAGAEQCKHAEMWAVSQEVPVLVSVDGNPWQSIRINSGTRVNVPDKQTFPTNHPPHTHTNPQYIV